MIPGLCAGMSGTSEKRALSISTVTVKHIRDDFHWFNMVLTCPYMNKSF